MVDAPSNNNDKQGSIWQSLVTKASVSSLPHKHQVSLQSLIGLSDFIAESCLCDTEIIELLLVDDLLHASTEEFTSLLDKQLVDTQDEATLHKVLRKFRRLSMVAIAWRDLLNLQTIEASLTQVSMLANHIINATYQWLYTDLQKRYGTPMGEYGPLPMLILGMGKLGGNELNFSSDIDLIFTYPHNGNTQGGRKSIEHQQFFTKLAQKLIGSLNQHTVDGQVFRVDMRLRPFGESGPLVSHFAALEDYYQDQGREWERFAMIKARIINPDGCYDQELNDILQPFIYRRYLDYGAIDSLRKMKRLISQEVRRRGLKNNIKLGAGGIREVEFIVQSFQLIRGGRETSIQQPSLLSNLLELTRLNVLSIADMQTLQDSYLFLRKVEHCLQQFADQQTQTLPQDKVNRDRLITVLGFETYTEFEKCLSQNMDFIHNLFLTIIGDDNDESHQQQSNASSELTDLWQLTLHRDEMCQLLEEEMDPQSIFPFATCVEDFKNQLPKKGMGKRGRDTLESLMPFLLTQVVDVKTLPADVLLNRVFSVMHAILGRTTYLQLLLENPGVLTQLVKLCAASPWIAEQISRFPLLLDELLNPAELFNPTPLNQYYSELRQSMLRIDPDDLELQMEALRQFKLTQQLKIAAADVTNALPIMKVSDHLTFLAEAIIQEVVNIAWQQMTKKHGAPPNKSDIDKGFGVIGYGKLGGIELGYGSDLDLVFVHNCQHGEQTDGGKPLDTGHFYTKVAQRIMHLFSTKTTSGHLYEIDMRLRPSGNAGLLVCHIDGFETYQRNEAWTWEHQALVRARFICGEPELSASFNAIRKAILCEEREVRSLMQDVANMREKMRNHLNKGDNQRFDIKQDSGGIADIEFLVQFWVLANALSHPKLTMWSDNVRIITLLNDNQIINDEVAKTLTEAYLQYRNTSHILALQQQEVMESSGEFSKMREKIQAIWANTFSIDNRDL